MAKLSGYLLLSAVILAAGYVLLGRPSADLEFRPLAWPEGFRELVIENAATRSDAMPMSTETARVGATVRARKNLGEDVCRTLFRDPASPATGGDSAKVVLVEFFDYRCPYCKTLAGTIRRLERERPVRIVYKEWPILGEASTLAARAALAAARQGKYREFHRSLMQSGFVPTTAYIDALAAELGMDRSRLHADMNGSEVTLAISRTAALAAALGLVGTPSLVVGRTMVHGAVSGAQLESLIALEASEGRAIRC